ncbi:S1 family peptidase [Dehalococcoidia bacterium]|nr:S1 family peptidase [Dehalococcoidia bacterium]
MKLKGIKTIALLLAAVILVIGSVAGLAVAAGGGAREEYTPAADAYYWWEFVAPERRENLIGVMEVELDAKRAAGFDIPEVDVMRLTRDELERLMDVPPPRIVRPRLKTLEEAWEFPATIAVLGRPPTDLTEAEREEWHDGLHKLRNLLCRALLLQTLPVGIHQVYPGYIVETFGVTAYGFFLVGLNRHNLTIEQAHLLVPGIYEAIASVAETIGIEDVPVIFTYGRSRLDRGYYHGGKTPWPYYDIKYRPIVGGIMESIRGIPFWATIGFAVARQMGSRWRIDYTITGHRGPAETPIGAAVYQPEVSPTYRAGTVADSPTPGQAQADVARVAFYDHNIDPNIHVGHGWKRDVVAYTNPHVGQSVLKSGARTGATPGTVVCVNFVWDSPTFGLMPHHTKATYHALGGDSGAPLYESLGYPCYGAVILGVHVGQTGWFCPQKGEYISVAVLSPVSELMDELWGWRPYTIHTRARARVER